MGDMVESLVKSGDLWSDANHLDGGLNGGRPAEPHTPSFEPPKGQAAFETAR